MFKQILFPIDLSQESSWRKALPVAIDQARHGSAQLHIVAVVPDIPQLPNLPTDYGSQMVPHTEQELRAFIDEHVPGDLAVTHEVRQGTVYREVLSAAQSHDIDLIVMASHRPEPKDYLLGPNAARVVRHATCSVAVIRE